MSKPNGQTGEPDFPRFGVTTESLGRLRRGRSEAFRPSAADVLPRRPVKERVNGVVEQTIEGRLRTELRNLKPGDSVVIFREDNDDRPEFTVTVREHAVRS